MMKNFIRISFVIFLVYSVFSCKKEDGSDDTYSDFFYKVKSIVSSDGWSGYYTYDTLNRLFELDEIYEPTKSKRYNTIQYIDSRTVVKKYSDNKGTTAIDTLFLNDNGCAIKSHYYLDNNFYFDTFYYNNGFNYRKGETLSISNGNVIKSEVSGSKIVNEFYTDKINYLFDGNFIGVKFYGRFNRNLIKKTTWFSKDGTIIYTGEYTYVFDSNGRVSKRTDIETSNPGYFDEHRVVLVSIINYY